MIKIRVEFGCDWGGCDTTYAEEHGSATGCEAGVRYTDVPRGLWIRVGDRVYCRKHEICIRQRNEAAWHSSQWVEEKL